MSTTEPSVHARMEDLFAGTSAKAQAKREPGAAKARAAGGRRMFNGFRNEDIRRATAVASEFMRIAEQHPDSGTDALHAVMTRAEELLPTEPAGLVQHALGLFVTHYPAARKLVRLPSLERRQPHVARSASAMSATGSTPPEDLLDYWREDPLICDHHGHWHLVYPMSGRPVPSGPPVFNDRHGELFAYMHHQMLARYDAERLCAGLPRVTQLDDYRSPIDQGYDPGPLEIWDGDEWYLFRGRPAGATMSDLTPEHETSPGAKLADMEQHRDRMNEASRSGVFRFPDRSVTVDIDSLGSAEEANDQSVDHYGDGDPRNFMYYGTHHAVGHSHLMYFDNVEPMGVTGSFTTTPRDPAFWRWHKHVDSFFMTYQDHQEPHDDFGDGPPATIVSVEVTPSDEELLTEMVIRQLEVPDTQGTQYHTIRFLSHDDFGYRFTAENPTDADLPVTVRVFFAPETQVEQRDAWIEMDRFTWNLTPGINVTERASDESSVIRKPARRPADLTATDDFHAESDAQGWCDCGWPYTLLLPRGSAAGTPFRIMVVLTSGDDLQPPDHCAPFSYYCGVENFAYPDKKPMGYPFDRPFRRSISATVENFSNWTWRPIAIRCRNPEPSTASSQVPPFHATTETGDHAVYHNNSECEHGKRIKPEHRGEGAGDRELCQECRRLA